MWAGNRSSVSADRTVWYSRFTPLSLRLDQRRADRWWLTCSAIVTQHVFSQFARSNQITVRDQISCFLSCTIIWTVCDVWSTVNSRFCNMSRAEIKEQRVCFLSSLWCNSMAKSPLTCKTPDSTLVSDGTVCVYQLRCVRWGETICFRLVWWCSTTSPIGDSHMYCMETSMSGALLQIISERINPKLHLRFFNLRSDVLSNIVLLFAVFLFSFRRIKWLKKDVSSGSHACLYQISQQSVH